MRAESHKILLLDLQYQLNKLLKQIRNGLLVITGGEPMLQQRSIWDLLDTQVLAGSAATVEIETNGTIIPEKPSPEPHWWKYVHFNVSPKLDHSLDPSRPVQRQLIDEQALRWFKRRARTCFKFVVSRENMVQDLDTIAALGVRLGIGDPKIWVMPQADNVAELDRCLPRLIRLGAAYGFNVSDRLHIRGWYGERAH